ncbi:hypothetical protein E2562_012449 [Oryza meyeriana var. granulata]|uniref:Uncharacterized protein n=1 Tax=Oryza meyeriana var. granulata TaxID=110450 RepID=A0A6G1C5X4_9ORYZ|nr:hypothetical protein E2562_012449 [Oryza meyeriana var. granulata]
MLGHDFLVLGHELQAGLGLLLFCDGLMFEPGSLNLATVNPSGLLLFEDGPWPLGPKPPPAPGLAVLDGPEGGVGRGGGDVKGGEVLPPSPAPRAGLPLPLSSTSSSSVLEICNAQGTQSPVPSFGPWALKSGSDLWIATRSGFERRTSSRKGSWAREASGATRPVTSPSARHQCGGWH